MAYAGRFVKSPGIFLIPWQKDLYQEAENGKILVHLVKFEVAMRPGIRYNRLVAQVGETSYLSGPNWAIFVKGR